ncbi:MAG: hypothetical protein IRY91_00395 [Gemmatimonadaceae bacterium]|nr:hypothetical protein [Gemmatimonadaceae bacterium]
MLAACERSRTTVPRDTALAVLPESAQAPNVPPAPPAWTPEAGPVMLVRSGNALDAAYVVFPEYNDSTLPDTVRFDTRSVRGLPVELIGHDGAAGTARVASASSSTWIADSCVEWPTARLELAGDSAQLADWTVAFEHASIRPIRLDSLQTLPSPDSARLAADITRLASALPDDTSRTFRGIPFVVRAAYRFAAAPRVQAIAADVVRKLNQEATPLEQHTLIVAERDAANPQAPYHAVYHERTAGSEESIETSDVLAGIQYPTPGHMALVLVREGIDATAYALLERGASGRWRVRWTSVHTGC